MQRYKYSAQRQRSFSSLDSQEALSEHGLTSQPSAPKEMSYGVVPARTSVIDGSARLRQEDLETQALLPVRCSPPAGNPGPPTTPGGVAACAHSLSGAPRQSA